MKGWGRVVSSQLLQKVRLPYAQLCPTLCDPMDCSLPGSCIHGIQARILELVAMPSSKGASPSRGWTRIFCVFCIAGGFFTCWVIGESPEAICASRTQERPFKRMHSVRPHSTGAAHGAASGREGRGAWEIREMSAPTAPPAYWGPPTGGMQMWQGRVAFLMRQGTQWCCDAFLGLVTYCWSFREYFFPFSYHPSSGPPHSNSSWFFFFLDSFPSISGPNPQQHLINFPEALWSCNHSDLKTFITPLTSWTKQNFFKPCIHGGADLCFSLTGCDSKRTGWLETLWHFGF